ncbi:MAG: PilZ domain-containing protein [Elusimicrobia bacterium]|nr:PilZ domain-containing protein [Candidatus Liberimonas magnetica]
MKTYERYKLNVPIEFRDDIAELHKGLLDNISSGGMCFKSMKHLSEGKNLYITIYKKNNPIKTAGKVVWCQRSTKCYYVGVKFLEEIQFLEIQNEFF